MAREKNGEEMDKGFVVRDRRFSAKKEDETGPELKEEQGRREPSNDEKPPQQEGPLPEVSFMNFILSLSTSALLHLGEVEDPNTKQTLKNLPLAKQTIDMIAMLKDRTKGNVTPQEEKALESILYDLRLRYVKAKA